MQVISVPAAIIQATFERFIACGRGRHECITLWIGEKQTEVTALIHPMHASSRGSYELDGAWLNEFWQELGKRRTSIIAQIHTHPGRAFHSDTDDDGAIAVHAGFLSIVIPHFGSSRSLVGGCAYEMTNSGWELVELADVVKIL
jgi:hypothetical protein